MTSGNLPLKIWFLRPVSYSQTYYLFYKKTEFLSASLASPTLGNLGGFYSAKYIEYMWSGEQLFFCYL